MASHGQSNADPSDGAARANIFQTTGADRSALFQLLGRNGGTDSWARPIQSAADLNPAELAECFRILSLALCATSDAGPPSAAEMEKFLADVFERFQPGVGGQTHDAVDVPCNGPILGPQFQDMFSGYIGKRVRNEKNHFAKYRFRWESDPYKFSISIVDEDTEIELSEETLTEYDWFRPAIIRRRAKKALQELSNQMSRSTEDIHIDVAMYAAAYFISSRSRGLSMHTCMQSQSLDNVFFHSSRIPLIFPVLPMPERDDAPDFRI